MSLMPTYKPLILDTLCPLACPQTERDQRTLHGPNFEKREAFKPRSLLPIYKPLILDTLCPLVCPPTNPLFFFLFFFSFFIFIITYNIHMKITCHSTRQSSLVMTISIFCCINAFTAFKRLGEKEN